MQLPPLLMFGNANTDPQRLFSERISCRIERSASLFGVNVMPVRVFTLCLYCFVLLLSIGYAEDLAETVKKDSHEFSDYIIVVNCNDKSMIQYLDVKEEDRFTD